MYNLSFYDKYILVNIEDKIYFLDTGGPSLSFDSSREVVINSRKFNLMALPLSKSAMLRSFGRIVNGSIGKDIIKAFGIIEIDKLNSVLTFGSTKYEVHNPIVMNDFVFDIKVNDKSVKGYFDTGAHIALVSDKSLLNLNNFIREDIEASFTGDLRVSVYKISMGLSNYEINAEVLFTDDYHMHQNSIALYFNLEDFAKKYYVINCNDNYIYFE